MKPIKRLVSALAVAAVLAALPATAADFTTYVALGDSLTAGYTSGGLEEFFQEHSYPAIIAKQAGSPVFEQPLVSEPGLPPLLMLQHLVPSPVIVPSSATPGQPLNATYPAPYNNLGVPGATLYDMLFTTGNIQNLLAGHLDNVMHDLILRDGQHTALEQAIGLNPTFVTVWIGNNDILGAAVMGTPVEGVTMTPVANFQQMYQTALGALAQNTSADIMAINIPDVTAIPFVTTVKPYITLPDGTHVPLIGSNGPLPEDAYVTLNAAPLLAQGIGVPQALGGTGQPLPEDIQIVGTDVIPGVVLRPAEIQVIEDRIAAFNQIIQQTAQAVGARVFDVNSYFNGIAAGQKPTVGAIELSTDFLTGGIFGYDGVHPQAIGYGMLATEMIRFINETYQMNIPLPNMYEIMTGSPNDQPAPVSVQEAERAFTPDAEAALLKLFAPKVQARLQQHHLLRPDTGAVRRATPARPERHLRKGRLLAPLPFRDR